jgi:hypothetical protein
VLAPGLEQQLPIGLPIDLVIDLESNGASASPVVTQVGACRVTFDLWEEVYRVRLPSSRAVASPTITGLVRECTDAQAYATAISASPPGAKLRRIVRKR